MFTGIIQSTGDIASIDKSGDWVVTISAGKLPLENTAVGASISCNGICLTVIEKTGNQFKVQISAETLSKTTALHWKAGMRLNLESSLKMGDELGGHMVSGHIDGVAKVKSKTKERDSLQYIFE